MMTQKKIARRMARWGSGAAALLVAVSAHAAADEAASPSPGEAPTFSNAVAHVIYNNCTTCHRPGGGAPMNFLSYEDVQKRARMIARVTLDGSMPPWKAEPGDIAFHGERHLAEHDIATLSAWAEAGAPLGEPAAVPPVPVFSSDWPHGEPDMIIQMEQDMPIPADGPDIYRGFAVRVPDLPEGKYLKGMAYRPKAIGSAHHTLFSLDTTGDARNRAKASTRPGFGGMESNLSVGRIGGWAVGAIQPLYPEGVSIDIKPGTDMVLSTHFHPSGKPEVERAEIALYLTDEAPKRYMTGLDLPFAFGLLKGINIPPGEKHYVVNESFTMPVDAKLSMVSPHAHYIAKSMKAVATFADGKQRTLISVRDWNFAWQEQYQLEAPLLLPAGTRIDLEFIYDNSADNPRNPNSPPKAITFGPSSTDEMACITMALITETEEQNQLLRRGYVASVKEAVKDADLSTLLVSARTQRRDRFDLDGDGEIIFAEIRTVIGQLRKRFANPDPDNVQMEVLPLIGKRLLATVFLPWLLPRAAVALLLLVMTIMGLRYLLARRRERRLLAT